jgi:hypothetical protein
MSLRRACVDKARAVYDVEDPAQPWIEGEPWAEQQLGPWFRCRLTVQQPTEGTGVAGMRGMAARGYHRMEGEAHLLLLPVYEDGSSLTDGRPGVGEFLAFDDMMMLQVISEASADELWHVSTGIQPIRKLKRVIGFEVGLRRAREPRVVEGPLPTEGSPRPTPLVGAVDLRERALRTLNRGGEVGL